jgi:hypothetical protein
MKNTMVRSIVAGVGFATVLAVSILSLSARGAEPSTPVFPPGSRVGLVPPPGMKPSETFSGFVDPAKNAGIIISILPAGAYADMEKALTDEGLKKQGVTLEKRQSLQLGIGNGELVVGTQLAPDKTLYRKWLLLVPTSNIIVAVTAQAPESASAYSNAVILAALSTLALRSMVPEAEFLSLLPFKVGDFSGFQIANVMPGRALLLIDAPKNPHMVVTQGLPEYEFDARFIVAAVPQAPGDPVQRANFARNAFGTIGGVKDVQITMAEPVRIDSQEGFETVATAKDDGTGAKLMVIQWLRFGSGKTLQMIGISRADIWDAELAHMRAMRDSIQFK